MNKKLIFVLTALCIINLYPQSERLRGMGGLSYIIYDDEASLNPFDKGNNPSWLFIDETNSWLRMMPSFNNKSGDYKRRFDPENENNYVMDFMGVKTLGEDGTFLGETSYMYTTRKNLPRSLKYNTYSGEGLFFTDTTTGNFRYNGPQVMFMYSFEALSNLYTGASIRYKILNGLKDRYSRAETIFRDVEGNVGLSYKITDQLAAGVNYIHLDGQEKIESKSEDLQEVEVFNYFGDTYSIRSRTAVEQKIKNKGNTVGAQIYYKPDAHSEFALTGTVSGVKQQILIPYVESSIVSSNLDEFEEGYSNFNTKSLQFLSRYEISDGIFAGVSGSYNKSYAWTKNSIRQKLIWEWDINSISGGAGLSWRINPELVIGLEYLFSDIQADSSKYIDSKFVNVESGNHLIKVGLEYELIKGLDVRTGYNLNALEKDFIYGGSNINITTVTLGFGVSLFENIDLDFYAEYVSYGGIPGGLERNGYSAFTSIKLNTF